MRPEDFDLPVDAASCVARRVGQVLTPTRKQPNAMTRVEFERKISTTRIYIECSCGYLFTVGLLVPLRNAVIEGGGGMTVICPNCGAKGTGT